MSNEHPDDLQRPPGWGSGMNGNPVGRSSWPENSGADSHPGWRLLGLAVCIGLIVALIVYATVWS